MSEANHTLPLHEAKAATPFIHVAGDLIVRLDSNPLSGLAGFLAAPLASAIAVADRSAAKDDAAPRKILADGNEVPASDPRTDHVAVLFPDTGWIVAVKSLAANGRPFKSQQATEEAGKTLQLLGYNDWQLAPDTVYERHVIDRCYHEPAVDKNLFPDLPTDDWYWTSTVAPWSSASAFDVSLRYGLVHSFHRSYSGFGLACRRARQ